LAANRARRKEGGCVPTFEEYEDSGMDRLQNIEKQLAILFALIGGSIKVKDGSTTVDPTTTLEFTSGATVTNAGSGKAQVAVSGGGGTPFRTAPKTADTPARAGDSGFPNPAAGNVTITLPTTPTNGSIVGVKRTDLTVNTLSVAAGPGDDFDFGG